MVSFVALMYEINISICNTISFSLQILTENYLLVFSKGFVALKSKGKNNFLHFKVLTKSIKQTYFIKYNF